MLQQTAMMALGYFVFMHSTTPYQKTSRKLNWSHAENTVVGAMPKTQFTGKASETMSISGTLYPEITGGPLSLTALELMAEQGAPYPLISGSTFLVLGWFVIESISIDSEAFFGDGTPRKIDFTLELTRTDDSILSDIVDEVLSYI